MSGVEIAVGRQQEVIDLSGLADLPLSRTVLGRVEDAFFAQPVVREVARLQGQVPLSAHRFFGARVHSVVARSESAQSRLARAFELRDLIVDRLLKQAILERDERKRLVRDNEVRSCLAFAVFVCFSVLRQYVEYLEDRQNPALPRVSREQWHADRGFEFYELF